MNKIISLGRVSKDTRTTGFGSVQDTTSATLKHCLTPAGQSSACYGVGATPGQESRGSVAQQCRFALCETL